MPFFFVDRDARNNGPARSLLAPACNGLAACWQGREAFASAGQATPVFGATGALTNRVKHSRRLAKHDGRHWPASRRAVPPIFTPEEGEKIGTPTPAARRAAGDPFLTRTKLGHPRGDLFNSFDRRLT
ncbi:hypothetical protein Saro_3978 (plasmid) [Novosphingobium aromaticivorans DSM 12444]|jgi:hypothetical protein|uniref:Uncharacterized protein n=2 Tax=Novosphingobium aromaticivorans TaxID=48935 RepID=A4XE59_NOVAD|nr:unknown [Novosphingobium aromaticivorans]ABP64220.1 hypothetical protein Saro_3978 [Novosphingobium aromaticivorans DSM 12444]